MTGKIKFPRHRLLRRRRPTYSPVPTCNRTTFSATIQLRQSDHRTNISYKKVFFSYDCGPIPSYDFTHDAPRSPHDGSTKTPPWRRRASQPDTNRWLLPPPSSVPIGTRPQAGSKLHWDQNQPRKSAIAVKASQPDTNRLLPATLFRPQSDHGPTLAQSYSRNNTNTMRAET